MKEEIAGLNEARERERPLVLEAEAKVKELRQTIDNLNSLQSNLRKERQSMKDKAQEMNANVRLVRFNSDYALLQICLKGLIGTPLLSCACVSI